jgi:hypothetical protein
MISLVMGLVVLAAALSFAVQTWRTFSGGQLREEVHRNARFVTMSLERDFQFTGVGLGRTASWGTLAAWGDTILVLGVPFEPTEAPPYDLEPGPGTSNPLPAGGTCGAQCVNLNKDTNGNFDLAVGELARLQVKDTRRLILVQSVSDLGTEMEVWFSAAPNVLRYPAGLTGGLLLDRFGTFVQELRPVVYYVDGQKLMRAQTFNLDGTPNGAVLAEGVQSWEVRVIFADGDEMDEANSLDADDTNNYDDVVGVRISAVLAADKPHPRVNNGALFTREYEWRFAPRNLMYERNRT